MAETAVEAVVETDDVEESSESHHFGNAESKVIVVMVELGLHVPSPSNFGSSKSSEEKSYCVCCF